MAAVHAVLVCGCVLQIASGALPGLLLLCCCGADGPPERLEAAATAAAAAAVAAVRGLSVTPASSGCSSEQPTHTATAMSSTCTSSHAGSVAHAHLTIRRPTASSEGATDGTPVSVEVLDSIAEPSYAAEEDGDDTASSPPVSSRLNDEPQEGRKAAGSKKSSKKSKKPAKLDPAACEAQIWASGAIKLLSLASDTSRLAVLAAGALPVLLPILDGSVTAARWHARQVHSQRSKLKQQLSYNKVP